MDTPIETPEDVKPSSALSDAPSKVDTAPSQDPPKDAPAVLEKLLVDLTTRVAGLEMKLAAPRSTGSSLKGTSGACVPKHKPAESAGDPREENDNTTIFTQATCNTEERFDIGDVYDGYYQQIEAEQLDMHEKSLQEHRAEINDVEVLRGCEEPDLDWNEYYDRLSQKDAIEYSIKKRFDHKGGRSRAHHSSSSASIGKPPYPYMFCRQVGLCAFSMDPALIDTMLRRIDKLEYVCSRQQLMLHEHSQALSGLVTENTQLRHLLKTGCTKSNGAVSIPSAERRHKTVADKRVATIREKERGSRNEGNRRERRRQNPEEHARYKRTQSYYENKLFGCPFEADVSFTSSSDDRASSPSGNASFDFGYSRKRHTTESPSTYAPSNTAMYNFKK